MGFDWKSHFRAASKRAKTAEFGAESPENIKLAQQKLNDLGFANPALVVDGDPGPKTQAAARAFQQSKGLTADGIIGPQTLAAMGIGGNNPSSPNTVPTPHKEIKRIPIAPIPGLQQSVADAFTSFTTQLEGYTDFMYPDSKGYITTGIGNKIDPVGAALALPWKHRSDNSLASQDEIAAEFNRLKGLYPGVQSYAAKPHTTLYLTLEDISRLVHDHLSSDHNVLMQEFENYTDLPADAQLGLHSISWAWGAGFPKVWDTLSSLGNQLGTKFKEAIADKRFLDAASLMKQANVHEEKINRGIIPRNAATAQLFANADAVVKKGLSLATLYYPDTVVAAATLGLLGYFWLGVIGFLGWEWVKKS